MTDHARPTPVFVGLDIGGTKIEAILVDEQLNLLAQTRLPTHAAQPAALLEGLQTAVYTLLRQAQAEPHCLAGIGAGVPGQVIPATGVVRLAANLNLADYPLGAALTAVFNVPITLENDVRTAAVGVYHRLRTQTPGQNLAYVSIGTGVAAGLVLNGRLYRGSHGMAGEIGHIIVEPDGLPCKCGARGCLETIASGPAIVQQALAAGWMATATAPNPGHVYQAAANGDARAQAVVSRASRALSLALQWLIFTYDVDQVVLGGGVTGAGAAFLTPITNALSRLRAQSDLLAELLAEDKFVMLPAGYNPGPWGAVLSVLAEKGLPN